MVGDGRSVLHLQQSLLRRALAAGEAGRLHVRFAGAVVERYRTVAGAQLLRTRSVGRIAIAGRWALDVGIAPDGSLHVPFQELAERLPEDEREHWLTHLIEEPASIAFLQMRLSPVACIEDGDTEPWS